MRTIPTLILIILCMWVMEGRAQDGINWKKIVAPEGSTTTIQIPNIATEAHRINWLDSLVTYWDRYEKECWKDSIKQRFYVYIIHGDKYLLAHVNTTDKEFRGFEESYIYIPQKLSFEGFIVWLKKQLRGK